MRCKRNCILVFGQCNWEMRVAQVLEKGKDKITVIDRKKAKQYVGVYAVKCPYRCPGLPTLSLYTIWFMLALLVGTLYIRKVSFWRVKKTSHMVKTWSCILFFILYWINELVSLENAFHQTAWTVILGAKIKTEQDISAKIWVLHSFRLIYGVGITWQYQSFTILLYGGWSRPLFER